MLLVPVLLWGWYCFWYNLDFVQKKREPFKETHYHHDVHCIYSSVYNTEILRSWLSNIWNICQPFHLLYTDDLKLYGKNIWNRIICSTVLKYTAKIFQWSLDWIEVPLPCPSTCNKKEKIVKIKRIKRPYGK